MLLATSKQILLSRMTVLNLYVLKQQYVFHIQLQVIMVETRQYTYIYGNKHGQGIWKIIDKITAFFAFFVLKKKFIYVLKKLDNSSNKNLQKEMMHQITPVLLSAKHIWMIYRQRNFR